MSGGSHVLFLILTIIFPPFLLLWVICACSASGARKKKDRELMERQVKAMEEIARVGMWSKYRD